MDFDKVDLLVVLLRGAGVGALTVWAFALISGRGPRDQRLAGAVFCLAAAGYGLNEHPLARDATAPLAPALWILSVAAAGWAWLFARALFRDAPLTAVSFGAPLVLTATGFLGWFGPERWSAAVWYLHHALELVIAGHLVWIIAASWRGDLLEARRRLRAPVLAAIGVFISGLALLQMGLLAWPGELRPEPWLSLLFAGLASGSAAAFLRSRDELFGASTRETGLTVPTEADKLLLERLASLMDEEQVWRQEGLTIGQLAGLMPAPEYRLRRAIHDRLGFRNFAAFVNKHRVAEAKRILADPGQARTTVAALAFDLGFGSLGPFNRAFRAEVGMTPSRFRSEARSAVSR